MTSNEAKLKTKSRDISPKNKEMNFEYSESLQNLVSLKNKNLNSRELNFSKIPHGRTTYIKAILSHPKLSLTQNLAKKLAKEALESPKMQEEFKKLTVIKSRKRNSRETREKSNRKENVIRSIKAVKGYYKPVFKGPKRKKRKKYKCGFGLRWCTDSDFSRHNCFKKVPSKIREEAICKRETRNPFMKLNNTPNDSRMTRQSRKIIERESMLEKVMQTTTKDPKKKNPGDQGIEYSEYYNDDDVVNNPDENIQSKDADFKNSVIRYEREITDKSMNIKDRDATVLQKGSASLNQDDEYVLDGNESNVFLSDSNQNRNKNQVYQQNQINQQRQPNQRNQIYRNIYQANPYLISNPEKYRRIVQQSGLTPYPQFLYPNQYSKQFKNPQPNQILSSIKKPLNQSKEKMQMKNHQIYKGSNYKRNQALVSVKEPQQIYPGIEVTSLNSTVSESSTPFTTICTSATVGSENAKKRLDETLAMKYNLKPMNSLVPFTKGHAVERQNQQLNSTVSNEDTQVIANKILNKIVDELEELKADKPKKSQKEGRPCRISGSWATSRAGVELNMKVLNYSIAIIIKNLESPVTHEGLLNTSWNLSGQVPFRHGGPFTLTGVNNKTKSLAVFVGSCRVCQGTDTIEGIWTVSEEPHNCRDFRMATGIYNDIFRRMRLHIDKKNKEKEKSNTGLSIILSSTMSSSTNKS